MVALPFPPASIACIEMRAPGGECAETERVCFVCMESCDEKSKCKCVDRYVHPACLLKWLQPKQSTRCDVCLGEYSNVEVRTTKTSRRLARSCLVGLCGGFCFVAMAVGAVFSWNEADNLDKNSLARFSKGLAIALAFVSFLTLLVCVVGVIRFRREGCRIFSVVAVGEPRVVVTAL